ncbi:hypothetical protein ACH50O_23555 (plasmid) [Methylomonas sp. 2BW1-5-20]|uniref:hypothetical protein n=1 Tax=Methylomonas sp. 2BW1-5-20 TaxID=3376686 RepID=UPI00404F5D5F
MTENNQKDALIISHKKGVPVYATNPSVPDPDSIKKRRAVKFGDDKRGFVVDNGSGEVLSVGGMGFYEFEEVDNARFVKLFLAGLKQAAGLSKAGLAVFELIYSHIQNNPNSDKVELSFYTASNRIEGLNERTYQRGLRELLEKEFLFRSPSDGVFFINIRYMFNGDRLAFVKGYRRKGAPKDVNQLSLFDDVPDVLASSDGE